MLTSKFSSIIVGPPGFERFLIRDNRQPAPTYYVGEGPEWSPDQGKARRYVNMDDLGHDIQAITVGELQHLGLRRFTLTLDVTVLGDPTPEEVRQYLFDALTIDVDSYHWGNGPTEGSIVMVKTDTNTLTPAAGEPAAI